MVGEVAFEERVEAMGLDLIFTDEILNDLDGRFLVCEGGEESEAFDHGGVELLVGFSGLELPDEGLGVVREEGGTEGG